MMIVSRIGTSTLVIVDTIALLVAWLNTSNIALPLVLLGIVLILFYKLDIRVNDQKVKFEFGIGLIYSSIPPDQIIEAKTVRNSIWSGWGIRIHLAYTLYNVSGFDAVELTLKGRRQNVRIGANVPH